MIVINDDYKPDAYDVVAEYINEFWDKVTCEELIIIQFEQSYDGKDWYKHTCLVKQGELLEYDKKTEYCTYRVIYDWDWNEGEQYIRNLKISTLDNIIIPDEYLVKEKDD